MIASLTLAESEACAITKAAVAVHCL